MDAMVTIRQERPGDVAAREALLDLAYGPVRFRKPSQRLREGRRPARELSFVAADGRRIVGSVRLWQVSVGCPYPNPPPPPPFPPPLAGEGWGGGKAGEGKGGGLLLLGPLAVAPDARNRGIGSALMRRALSDAARLGHGAVLLVGDAAFYGRFGFSSAKTGALRLPAGCEQHRLLGCELIAGALDGARGIIIACGEPAARPARPMRTGFGRKPSVAAARAA
jgi:predicted N-acetyltransferase YhbS